MERKPITCPACKEVYQRTSKQVAAVIRRSDRWECRGCTTTKRNVARASPVGATRMANNGYMLIKTERGWMKRNRYVMEQKLGRQLLANEDVHHVNEIKTDDRPDNLELLPHVDHVRLTHTGAKRTGEALRNIRRSFVGRRNTKLNHQAAAAIRLAAAAKVPQKALQEQHRVSKMTIYRIVKKKAWIPLNQPAVTT